MSSSLLPASLLASLNDQHEQVALPPEEEPTQAAPAASGEDWEAPPEKGYSNLRAVDDDDDSDGLEAYSEWVEGSSQPSTEEEFEALAESAVDLLHAAKDGLSELYDSRFSSIIKRKFSQSHRLHLILVESLWYEDKLNMDNLMKLLKETQEKSPEFQSIQLIDLLEVANDYKGLRRRYRAKPINDKVAEGIRRNLLLVLKKYMTQAPDPLFMLGFYIVAAFSNDAVNLVSIIREEQKFKKETAA